MMFVLMALPRPLPRMAVGWPMRHTGVASCEMLTTRRLDGSSDTCTSPRTISCGDRDGESMSATSRVVRDYVETRSRILKDPSDRAAIVGCGMLHNIGRGLTRLGWRSFTGATPQSACGIYSIVSPGKLSFARPLTTARSRRQLKGKDDDALLTASPRIARHDRPTPRIAYTANAAAFYPQLAEMW